MNPWPETFRGGGFGPASDVPGARRARASSSVPLVAVPVLLICAAVGIHEVAPAIPLAALALLAVSLLILRWESGGDPDARLIQGTFAWGYLIRIVCAIFVFYWLTSTRGEPFLGGGDDAEYEWTGRELYRLWSQGDYTLPFYMRNNPGYFVVMAVICQVGEWLGGYHTLLPRIVNACIGGLVAPYLFLLARNVVGRRVAVAASLLAMGYPEFIFYSAVQLRDILIVFLFVFAMSHLTRFTVQGKTGGLVLALAGTISTFYLRATYGYLLLGGLAACLMASLLFQGGKVRRHRWGKAAFLGVAVFLLFSYLKGSESQNYLLANEGGTLLRPLESEYVSGQISQHRETKLSVAGDESLGAKFLTKIPFKIGFLVLPLVAFIMPYPPWYALTVPDPLMFAYFVNALAWTLLMPLGLIGLRAGWRTRFSGYLPVLIPLVLVLVASCSGGFQQRYKLPAMPFILVFAAVGWQGLSVEFRANRNRFYVWVQLGIATAYFGAKLATM